ncbi:MAG: ABC-type Fe3+ transport system, periplasmic component [Verrucomicrobiales bacterium]|nr:ABC-type Fe3+ transport system, periplasmic component [Verrucomicrobiales bacterium]
MSSQHEKRDHWFRDIVAYGPWTGLIILIPIAIIAWITLPLLSKLKSAANEVIIYTSQDQEYAEPIFNEFTKQTGIKVRAVYDNEAAKTVGLVNRLIAEKNNPQCDVFWNNEEFRTRQLAREGIISNKWISFGSRTRCIVVNTNLLPLAKAPHDCLSLVDEKYSRKVALAYPLFGTTSTHFLALQQRWTDVIWKSWCQRLAANKPFVVDGNSVVVKMVGRGEACLGLTDSDDIRAGQREGLPIANVDLAQDGLSIPNTVAIVRLSPHPAAAEILLQYLGSTPVHAALEQAGALTCQGTVGDAFLDETNPDSGTVEDWNRMLANQNTNLEFLKGLFLR